MTTDIAPVVDTEDLVRRATLLHELLSAVDTEKSVTKSLLSPMLPRGSKLTGHDPRTGQTLGSVSKSDPEPTAKVTDEEAFEAWVRAKYPHAFVARPVFGPADEVAAVLAQHAPHLVRHELVIQDAIRRAALKVAARENVPGTVREIPGGVVSIRGTAHAKAVVRELLAAGPIPLLALEATA